MAQNAVGSFVVSGALAGVVASNLGDVTTELACGIALGVGAGVSALTYLLSPDPKKVVSTAKTSKPSKKKEAAGGKKKGNKGKNAGAGTASAKKPKAQPVTTSASETTSASGVPAGEGKKKKKKKNKNKNTDSETSTSATKSEAAPKKAKDNKPAGAVYLNSTTIDANDDADSWVKIPSAEDKQKKQQKKKEKKAAAADKEDTSGLPEGHIKATMPVPPEKHGVLIGEGGKTLQALCRETETTIDIPRKQAASDQVTITGLPQSVDKAKGAIKSLITKGFSTVTNPGWVQQEVAVSSNKIGAVIGKGGENIKKIQTATGVRISTGKDDKIAVTGPKANVKAAKQHIMQLASDGFSPITHPGFVRDEVEFPRQHLNVLIGAKGQTIKSIQGDTKTKINIPDAEDPNQAVVVVGQEAGVARARTQILNLLKGLEEPDEQQLQDEYDWNATADGDDEDPNGWGSLNAGGDWDMDA